MSKGQTLRADGIGECPSVKVTVTQGIEQLFAEFREQLGQGLALAASPYRDRAGAAGYLNCSAGHVDQLAAKGLLKPDKYDGLRPLWAVKTIEVYLIAETQRRQAKRGLTANHAKYAK